VRPGSISTSKSMSLLNEHHHGRLNRTPRHCAHHDGSLVQGSFAGVASAFQSSSVNDSDAASIAPTQSARWSMGVEIDHGRRKEQVGLR
jgi:hypothetical protein